MTKADIIEKIHTTTGLSKKDSAEMMESVFTLTRSYRRARIVLPPISRTNSPSSGSAPVMAWHPSAPTP